MPHYRTLKSRLATLSAGALMPWAVWAAGLDYLSGSDNMLKYAALPVTSVDSAQPQAMITLSKDHSLWLKAYNDFSDVTGDGVPDTTYLHRFRYYGYFDDGKCYTHDGSIFVPAAFADADRYCNGSTWSGNFLNWASMARIDVVRRILFGGKRLIDGSVTIGDNRTVLERAYLPNDAHSWAKHYAGPDINRLTPFNPPVGLTGSDARRNGITLCNTTRKTNNPGRELFSEPPLIRVATGNFSLWAANERWQCLWQEENPGPSSSDANRCTNSPGSTGCNDNDPALTGIAAFNRSPIRGSERLGDGDYEARVQVCVSGFASGDRCKEYPDSTLKPIGLLQEYGDTERMWFGVVTGTYDKNKSGGDVQKRVGPFTDEVNVNVDGRFVKTYGLKNAAGQNTGSQQANANGIINSLSLFRIVDYRHSDGLYDDCDFRLASFADGRCKNWGNPLAEAYLAALRWFANQNSAVGAFRGNESNVIDGLNTPTNRSPSLSDDNSCASLNTIVFNSSVISYDGDQLDTASYGAVEDLNSALDSRALTNLIGRSEDMVGKPYFVGENGQTVPGDAGHQICTAKTVNNLGDVRGVCPEAPRLEGTFRISGLAYHAYANDMNSAIEGDQSVKTFVVQLANASPINRIPVPGNPNQTVTLLPSCQNDDLNPDTPDNRLLRGACSIIDFKIAEPHSESGGIGRGALYVNWENGEQGGDFDQDLWGMIRYEISSSEIKVTTNVIGYSGGGARMGFGYIISGTSQDGVHYHSGAGGNNGNGASGGRNSGPFYFQSPYGGVDCSTRRSGGDAATMGCRRDDPATTRTFALGNSEAQALREPLWYAAKYGGYSGEHTFGSGAPLARDQWDTQNARGESIPDGNPDNYFFAAEPRQLEESLRRVFDAIIGQTSSGTAASVVANAREGVGAVFQALFEPVRRDTAGNEVAWIGSLHALWIDELGRLREDGNSNAMLDDFAADPVVEIFFDETNPTPENRRTRVRRFLGDPEDAETSVELVELTNLRVIWNARDRLAALSDAQVTTQRPYDAPASQGRHILTFLDLNQNGRADANEQAPFVKGTFSARRFGILNAPTKVIADRLVDYTRGQDDAGLRTRTLDFFNNNQAVTLRLGDIVQSTPTVAATPAEAFDLLYDDATYAAFRERYRNRRQMVYVGANDGLLHAFNAGFYDTANQRFNLTGTRNETQHPLGSEVWAYAPYNLLPHLTWLTDTGYQHVWYVDGKPRIFDARVYDRPCSDARNPCGWATLMVVGFRFGGGDLVLPANRRGNNRRPGFEDFTNVIGGQIQTRSAYVVLDVTDPEQPPRVLAELSGEAIGFTTSFPTVVSNSQRGRTPANNPDTDRWYLVFGSGPDNLNTRQTNLVDAANGNPGKFFIHDLTLLAAGNDSLRQTYNLGNNAPNSFVGDPVTADWDLNFKADTVYFGTIATDVSRRRNDDDANAFISSQNGALFKLDLREAPDSANWVEPKIMLQPGGPAISTPSVSFDELGNRWVYAASGRLYTDLDKPTDFQNWVFGVIDVHEDTASAPAPLTDFANELIDVSGAVVKLDNTVTGVGPIGGTTPSDVPQLEQLIGQPAFLGENAPVHGWRFSLQRTASLPSERNVTQTSVLGDVVFASGFTPSSDLCGGEGGSDLYGVYYKTGTPRGDLPIFGSVSGGTAPSDVARRSVGLGAGVASAPSLHVGAARDGRGITVLTQTSTGAIESQNAAVGAGARSGEIDWREPRQ